MIKSQIITVRVMYDDDEEGKESKLEPAQWDWDNLVDEPIRGAVEVLAAGQIIEYPRPVREE